MENTFSDSKIQCLVSCYSFSPWLFWHKPYEHVNVINAFLKGKEIFFRSKPNQTQITTTKHTHMVECKNVNTA